jgi:hypothetical protein
MGKAVHGDRFKARIRDNHFLYAFRGRISPEGRLHVKGDGIPYRGKLLKKIFGQKFRGGMTALAAAGGPAVPCQKSKAFFRLAYKFAGKVVDLFRGDKPQVVVIGNFVLTETGEDQFLKSAEYVFNAPPAGEI